MASLNLAGKTSGYVKLKAPDDSSNNPTVELPTESGELALKSDITGGGGGIPEAPIDGKQYARKDADWTEVEATSGGGGDVVAQPPVAFDLGILTDFPIPNKAWTKVSLNNAPVDTESGFDSTANNYVVKKAGIYELNWDIQLTNGTGKLLRSMSDVKVNGTSLGTASDGFYSSSDKLHTSLSRSKIVELDVGDEIELFAFAEYSTGDCNARPSGVNLSGHMVSSFTEGSGGGDYTPEKMVWEDKTADRVLDTEYTNTNDVPLYVQLAIFTDGNLEDNYCEFIIDGTPVGASGIIGSKSWNNPLYIVPAGSKYKARISGSTTLSIWREARMPLAIAVGEARATSVDTAIGMVAPFAMDSVPTGWLHCDGSAVSRDTYSLLYSKIGDLYGNGDGSTTFNLPDLKDEFVRGSSDTLPVGNKQDDAFQGHFHTVEGSNQFGTPFPTGTMPTTGGGAAFNPVSVSSPRQGEHGAPRVADETRPRNVAMLYCINATAEPSSGGDSIWTEESGVAKYDGKVSIKKDLIIETDGFGVSWGRDNGSPRIYAEEDGELNFRHGGGSSAMKIDSAGKVNMTAGLGLTNLPTAGTPSNLYISPAGTVHLSTATSYSAEEVDKKLAIKDELIEKLSKRLDSLEKKLKKAK